MLNEKCVFLYTIFSGLMALCIFLCGYLPISLITMGTSNDQDLPIQIDNFSITPEEFYNSHIKKLVVISVDSLSMDFLTDRTKKNLPNTIRLINSGEACLIPYNVQSPSTSIQKIKTLVTGTTSSFLETIFEYNIEEMEVDNIFKQAKKKKLRLSLLGDESWTQVDNNLTKTFIRELDENDWNWLAPHYLAIKYSEFNRYSNSEYFSIKLRELDEVIQFIHAKLKAMKNNYIILIIGDTGVGRLNEYTSFHKNSDTIAPCIVIGNSCPPFHSAKIMNELDIAPTLAVLTGLPIPALSYGNLNSALLSTLSDKEMLYALHYNTARLLNMTLKLNLKYAQDPARVLFQNAVLQHGQYLRNEIIYNRLKLRDTISAMYSRAAESLSKQIHDLINTPDVPIQYLAFVLVLEAMIILLNRQAKKTTSKKLNFAVISVTNMMLLTWVLATGISKNGTSFIHMTRAKGFVIINVAMLMLCNSYIMASQKNFLVHLFSASTAVQSDMSKELIQTVSSKVDLATSNRGKMNSLMVFLVSGTIFHSFSLLELSYIKWEKWVWFFLWTSLCFLIICKKIGKLYRRGTPQNECELSGKSENFEQGVISIVLSILIMHRAIMAYTSIEYWLSHGNNHVCASICLCFGLVLLALTCSIYYEPFPSTAHKIVTHILLGLICCSIYMSNVARGNVSLPHYPISNGVFEMVLFWIIWSIIIGYGVGFCTIGTCYKGMTSIRQLMATAITCWACFMALLTHSHKVLLIPVEMLFGQAMSDIFKKNNQSLILSHIWLGHLFFHYQGVTYNLDSLDMAMDFLFSKTSNLLIYGILLIINIFSAPILSYLICVYGMLDSNSKKRASQEIATTNITFGCCRFLSMSMYLLSMLMHQCNGWFSSILGPKLLYEIVYIFLIAILMINMQIIGLFHDLSLKLRSPFREL